MEVFWTQPLSVKWWDRQGWKCFGRGHSKWQDRQGWKCFGRSHSVWSGGKGRGGSVLGAATQSEVAGQAGVEVFWARPLRVKWQDRQGWKCFGRGHSE